MSDGFGVDGDDEIITGIVEIDSNAVVKLRSFWIQSADNAPDDLLYIQWGPGEEQVKRRGMVSLKASYQLERE